MPLGPTAPVPAGPPSSPLEGFRDPRALYDSAARRSRLLEEVRELWRYRDLVVQLVRRDVVSRYKRSWLGVAWTMLNPLGTMIILTVVFSQAFGATPAYAVYVLSGLIAWNFFAQSTLSAMRHLVLGSGLTQRIYVPKTVFAVTAIGTGLVNLTLSLIPLLGVMLVTGLRPGRAIATLPVAVLLLTAFTLGVGLLLSTLAAYFMDVAELYEVSLPALFYLTPVIYPEEIVPEPIRWWLVNGNPLYDLLHLFRAPLYDGVWPETTSLLRAAACAGVMLWIGWSTFARKADEFAYRL